MNIPAITEHRKLTALLMLLFSLGLSACSTATAQEGFPITPETVALGNAVYVENCAACHGANLEGQPNWQERNENGQYPAPPHDETGHTWHHGDQHLKERILYGAAGLDEAFQAASTMPAYEGILTEAEIEAVIAYIKSTWPSVIAENQREATRRELTQ